MIVEDRWQYVYENGYTGYTGHDLEEISNYYPIGILGYKIENDDYVMRSIYINDAYAATPRSASISAQLEKTQNQPSDKQFPWVTVYVLYIKHVFWNDLHPGRPLP